MRMGQPFPFNYKFVVPRGGGRRHGKGIIPGVGACFHSHRTSQRLSAPHIIYYNLLPNIGTERLCSGNEILNDGS